MIEFLVLAIIILASAATAAYSLTLIDRIVNSQLYSFGLQFSLDWANPYWTVLRLTLALLGLVAAFTVVNMVFIYRKFAYQKQLELRASEMARAMLARRKEVIQPQPQPLSTPQMLTPQPEAPPAPAVRMPPMQPPVAASSTPGLIQCSNCGKSFSQPLRMLDFHGERPRVVSICPFCNEVIQPTRPQDGIEQSQRADQKKKRNNRTNEAVVTSTLG